MAARLHDWQSRLAAVMADYRDRSFAVGANDCCTFAGADVHAVTGRDPLARWGDWTKQATARRIIKKHGSLRAAVGTELGPEIPLGLVQPGDIGLFVDGAGADCETLAVWGGSAWLSTGAVGLVEVQASAIVTAWRCTGEVAHG